jgi:hypothetical protein
LISFGDEFSAISLMIRLTDIIVMAYAGCRCFLRLNSDYQPPATPQMPPQISASRHITFRQPLADTTPFFADADAGCFSLLLP